MLDIKELITRIEKIKYGNLCYNSPESMLLEQKHLILDLVEQLDEPPITDEQAWNKIAEAYPDSPQSLRNTLDNAVFGKVSKLQKHVMPKFFDDWAKRVIAKHDEFYAISLVARAGWGYGVDFELSENGSSSENKELLYWIIDECSDNCPNKKKAIEALLYGYEVEKEPEYHVILSKNTGGWKYTFLDEEGSIDRTNNKAHIPTFTEKKAKAIDERYWAFAVPVEEVAEG